MRTLSAVFAVLIFSVGANAATFTVDNTGIGGDVAPGDGVCLATTGGCTLRAAIEETNALAGYDVINIPAGTYSTENVLVADAVDVIGAGAGATTISNFLTGNNGTPASASAMIWLSRVTVTGPVGNGSLSDQLPLTVSDAVMSNVGASSGVTRVLSSRVTNGFNCSRGAINFTDTWITGSGTITQCDLFANRSTFENAPIQVNPGHIGSASSGMFINSTITGTDSGNSAGGPLDFYSYNYVTFANGARSPRAFDTTDAVVSNSIIDVECHANLGFTSRGHNISSKASCVPRLNQPTDINNTDPLLQPLALNPPGTTPTHALSAGSPAIDNAGALVRTDQRGVNRPQGAGPDRGSYEYCTTCTAGPPVVPSDFNLDGRSDVFWQRVSTGENAVWLMDGTSLLGSFWLPQTGTGWEFRGLGDFDGDGDADMRWRQIAGGGSGQERFWMMKNTAVDQVWIPSERIATPGTLGGDVLATGDFDGDGYTDFLTRDAGSGQVEVQIVTGISYYRRVVGIPSSDWQFIAARDFNGDGTADVVWRNTSTNETILWKMKGSIVIGTTFLAQPPSEWELLAAGDFNGDAISDLLWRNTQTWEIVNWTLDSNGNVVSTATIAQTPEPWEVVAVGRFNLDATDDLFWRHFTLGDNAVWLMSGGTVGSSGYLPDVPSMDWVVMAPR